MAQDYAVLFIYCFVSYVYLLERVIENVPNDGIIASSSVCNTLKIDRATSPIPGYSHCKKYFILFNIICVTIF